jgi:hypothetical protein
MVCRAGWGRAWVRFRDGSVRVITLLEKPEEGKELVALHLEGRWIVTKVVLPANGDASREDAIYDVWVEARSA